MELAVPKERREALKYRSAKRGGSRVKQESRVVRLYRQLNPARNDVLHGDPVDG